jgi:hypothetical protein
MTNIFQNRRLKQIENWMDKDGCHLSFQSHITIRLTNWFYLYDNNNRLGLLFFE